MCGLPSEQPHPPPITISRSHAMISQELLDILACPKCKGEVTLTEKKDGLVCKNCKLIYEIREDIPIMLIDEAKKLDD
jgi:hypothetical protein